MKPIKLRFNRGEIEVTPIMEIKAPRGTMILFEPNPYGPPSIADTDRQCEAIGLFMDQHKRG